MSALSLGELAISDGEFALFRDLVREHTGITLGPHKRHLLRARLGRRLRALGMTTFAEYYEYLTEPADGVRSSRSSTPSRRTRPTSCASRTISNT